MSEKKNNRDDLIGQTIAGRYRIISRLGAGGMGVAYRAWDEQEGRPVVIKIPKKIFLEDPKFAERFNREIRLLQGLRHPHIVPIVDVGVHEGLPYVAMRFLPGGSLSDRRLRDDDGKPRPNPPGMLHLWLSAVADALDHVHANGVVHRDVKPGNIFFDAYWNAFLGDFGIAKIVEESDTFDREHTLTATNMGIGTQEYMAPEQFTPKAVIDGRSDQYALAVMVYEMLAGARPFTGSTAHLIVEVTTQPVPRLDARRAGLPWSLVEAVHRGLAKNPGERFNSCRELAYAVLEEVPLLADEPDIARLLCPKCSNILKLPVSAAGRKGKCPKCQTEMKVANDLGALWLLDEARRQKRAAESADAADVEPEAVEAEQEADEEVIEVFKPVSTTTPIGRPLRKRKKQISAEMILGGLAAVGLVLGVLVFAWGWDTKPVPPLTYEQKLAKAEEMLRRKPDDPTSNDFVGRHWCFTKDKWPKGLPYLAKGGAFGLSALAQREIDALNHTTGGAGRLIAAARRWWDFAERQESVTNEVLTSIRKHAADIYLEQIGFVREAADIELANDWLDNDDAFRVRVSNRRPTFPPNASSLKPSPPPTKVAKEAPSPSETQKWPADAVVSSDTGHAYKVFRQSVTWNDAKQRCEQLGGHLVTISSSKEQAIVIDCIKQSGIQVDRRDGQPSAWDDKLWAGGTDQDSDGNWRWIDGTQWAFTSWVLNQPGNDGDFLNLCPHLGGEWNDEGTADGPLPPRIAGFICEWEPMTPAAIATGGHRSIFIDSAIQWLMNHQLDDGTWSFDLKQCARCEEQCSLSGSYPDRAGATSMALLACLSRGYTHRDGPYKKQIEAGLGCLEARAKSRKGILYQDGDSSLFVQGIAALALSECYAMTKDERFSQPAQEAMNHIIAMQDSATGGWPFRPGERCDTVATVVQLTALKSAKLAGLQVSPSAVKKAADFLDSVQAANGSAYGSSSPQDVNDRSSAAGLLGRIYLGWKNDNPNLQRFEKRLTQTGPTGDLAFEFLSSQVLHHMSGSQQDGESYKLWRTRLNEQLKRNMASRGHESGSCCENLKSDVSLDGGRLFCTALAAMTQGVYYRHLPIHRKESFPEPFLKEVGNAEARLVLPDPRKLTGFRESLGQVLSFKVVGTTAGEVWGNNPYTGDSLLGKAAVHAGYLRPGEAGVVSVTVLPGQQSYMGSTKNGVTTRRWGAHGLSYRIDFAVTSNCLAGTVLLNGEPFLTKARPVLSSLSCLDAQGQQTVINGAKFDYDAQTGRYKLTGLPDQEKFLMWLSFQRNPKDKLHLGGQFLFSAYYIDLEGAALEKRTDFPLNVEQVVRLRRPIDNVKVLAAGVCPKLKSPVTFDWDEVVGADAYEVEVSTWWRAEHPPGKRPTPIKQRTAETKIAFSLEPTKPDEYYRVAIKAFAGSRQIGDLMVVEEGAYGWWVDFIVRP
jgi:serine/threonine protein kinase